MEKTRRAIQEKIAIGRKHIPKLFVGFSTLPKIEQIALFGMGNSRGHPIIGGGRVVTIKEFMNEVHEGLKGRSVSKAAVSEGYPLIRALQFAANYWK